MEEGGFGRGKNSWRRFFVQKFFNILAEILGTEVHQQKFDLKQVKGCTL
jgi:hypothetical protein